MMVQVAYSSGLYDVRTQVLHHLIAKTTQNNPAFSFSDMHTLLIVDTTDTALYRTVVVNFLPDKCILSDSCEYSNDFSVAVLITNQVVAQVDGTSF
jgi:hypothetical protein